MFQNETKQQHLKTIDRKFSSEAGNTATPKRLYTLYGTLFMKLKNKIKHYLCVSGQNKYVKECAAISGKFMILVSWNARDAI